MKSEIKVRDLIIISIIAAASIVLKPYIKMLHLPKGYSGFITMMWVVLIAILVQNKWSATMFSAIQATLALCLGVGVKWGIWIYPGFIIPGLAVDLIMRWRKHNMVQAVIAGAAANMLGSIMAVWVFTGMFKGILMLTIVPAVISGGIGGVLACSMANFLVRINAIKLENDKKVSM